MQIQRLMERDSCTLEQAQAKVSSQMPLEEKRKLTTNYIDNDGSRDATVAQVKGQPQYVSCISCQYTVAKPLYNSTIVAAHHTL